MLGFLIAATVASVAGSAIQGHKNRKLQNKIAQQARKVAPPPMERSDDEANVRLGTIDNELTASGGQGSAKSATQRTNQIGQLGGKGEY